MTLACQFSSLWSQTSTSTGARDGVEIYTTQSQAAIALVWISFNLFGTTLQAGLANGRYSNCLCWSSSLCLAQDWESSYNELPGHNRRGGQPLLAVCSHFLRFSWKWSPVICEAYGEFLRSCGRTAREKLPLRSKAKLPIIPQQPEHSGKLWWASRIQAQGDRWFECKEMPRKDGKGRDTSKSIRTGNWNNCSPFLKFTRFSSDPEL